MSPIIIVIVSFIYCLDHLVENRDEFVKINKTVSVDVRGEEHHVDLLLRQIDATRLEQLMHTSAYVSVRQRTSKQLMHTSAYVSVRQRTSKQLMHTSAYVKLMPHV